MLQCISATSMTMGPPQGVIKMRQLIIPDELEALDVFLRRPMGNDSVCGTVRLRVAKADRAGS